MALEDLTGTDKGIDALVVTNPDGLDPKSEGDNHIRGVKNVLVNTFGPMDAESVALPGSGDVLAWDGGKYDPIVPPWARLDAEDQPLTGGCDVTSKNLGDIVGGTVTPDPGDRPLQHYNNAGAHQIGVSPSMGSMLLDITNIAGAGIINTATFTKVIGDAFTTTVGHKFRCHLSIGQVGSVLSVVAMQ
jgi:hypothetical protein